MHTYTYNIYIYYLRGKKSTNLCPQRIWCDERSHPQKDLCVCVCVCEKERQRDIHTERKREGEKERERVCVYIYI